MDIAEEDSLFLCCRAEVLFRSIVTAEGTGSASVGAFMENMSGAGLLTASINILNFISSRWYEHGPVMGLQVQLSGNENMNEFGSGWKEIDADKLSSIGSSDGTGNGLEAALESVASMEPDIPSIDAIQAMGRSETEL
jgi:hypothetical protein